MVVWRVQMWYTGGQVHFGKRVEIMNSKNRTEIAPIGIAEKLGFCTFSTASNVVFNFKDLFYLFFLTNSWV